ncbi:MAG: hypothetical protein ACI4HL_00030 [Ruminococcus sp.]
MGVISNIKSKYKVNKNILWVCNTVLLLLTSVQYIGIAVWYAVTGEWESSILLLSVLVLCVAVNIIDVLSHRKYINLPVAVVNIVVLAVSIYMLIISGDMMWFLWCVPAVTLIISIISVVLQSRGAKTGQPKNSMVRVAKVKLDFDFRPEDIIDEYRLALSRIEKKHNMGEKNRAVFEEEKEELVQDTHQILKEFINNGDVALLDKLETLYQAKRECIITEDNYLLWKNQLLKDEEALKTAKNKVQKLFDGDGIGQEEYLHRMELLSDEF